MYLDYWRLSCAPFAPQPDSRFLLLTPQHEQALAALHYSVQSGGEPVALCGEPGCGKTTLLRALRRRLPSSTHQVVFIPDLGCGAARLLRRVASHVTRNPVADLDSAMDALRGAIETGGRERTVVIMFDDLPDAPPPGLFEELRWLIDLEHDHGRFVVLLSAAHRAPTALWPDWLLSRFLTWCELGPLDVAQVHDYLLHRLKVAGSERDIFTRGAVERIADWSRGVPRLVNRVAHLAMHVAYMDGQREIDGAAVERTVLRIGKSPQAPTVAQLACDG